MKAVHKMHDSQAQWQRKMHISVRLIGLLYMFTNRDGIDHV